MSDYNYCIFIQVYCLNATVEVMKDKPPTFLSRYQNPLRLIYLFISSRLTSVSYEGYVDKKDLHANTKN
jgi:hypothetical protein